MTNQTFANVTAEDGGITKVLTKNIGNALLSIQIPNTLMGNNEVSENDIDFNRQNEYKKLEQPDETEMKQNEINTDDVERSEADHVGSKKTKGETTPKTKVERNLYPKYKVRPSCTDKCKKKCGEWLMGEMGGNGWIDTGRKWMSNAERKILLGMKEKVPTGKR